MTNPLTQSSYARTVRRFSAPAVAVRYPSYYGGTFRERRERRCLMDVFKQFAPGSRVLDLPCGTGRLVPLLAGAGFRVTAADVSPSMLQLARSNWQAAQTKASAAMAPVRFEQRDAMETKYSDGEFDGVICHRLFHHFNEPETRVTALKELRRICSGLVIVSFFNSFAVDAIRRRLKHTLRGTVPADRIPIPMSRFRGEICEAGLTCVSTRALLWGVSPMWFVVMRRDER